MGFDVLDEARSHLAVAKDQAEHAAALLAGVNKPDLDTLRIVHVVCLDAEVAVAEAHAKIASIAVLALGKPEWERMRSNARAERQAAGDDVQDTLDAALGEGRR